MWTLNAGVDPQSVERYSIPDSFLVASGLDPRAPGVEQDRIPDLFRLASGAFSYRCRTLLHETCIEGADDKSPVAWFEAPGYSGLASSPDGSPTWAAHSGPSVLLFTLENPPPS